MCGEGGSRRRGRGERRLKRRLKRGGYVWPWPVVTGQETPKSGKDAVIKANALAAFDQKELGPKQALLGAHVFQAEPSVALLHQGNHEAGHFVNEVVNVSNDTLQAAELANEDIAFGGFVNTRGNVDEAGKAYMEEGGLHPFVVEAGVIPRHPTAVAVG